MIEEILPGLVQWSAYHEGIGRTVYSALLLASGTVIDPTVPADGVSAVAALAMPERVVLTNRHHYRQADRYVRGFGCSVLCNEAGLGHFEAGRPVEGFRFDEQLAPDALALQLASICPEETTLLLDVGPGALCFGDGLTRAQDGALAFMPDALLGDDPPGVRAGLSRNLRRMLDEDFDALLFAHAPPIRARGRDALSEFVSRQPHSTRRGDDAPDAGSRA